MCRRDPQEWDRVYNALRDLIERASMLANRGGRVGIIARHVKREVGLLLDDLHAWEPDERVCYGEFWVRIMRYRAALDRIETWAKARAARARR